MNKLYVNQIFESVQGEGFHTGRAAIFVRFAGCNLECSFCDTKFSRKKEDGKPLEPQQILDTIKAREYKSKFVVLTGGEPMVQSYNALCHLIQRLKDLGYYVAMETNGVVKTYKHAMKLDWITVSPKNIPFWASGDELKLLYDGTQDLDFYEACPFKYFYLQPILSAQRFVFFAPSGELAEFEQNVKEVTEAFEKVRRVVMARPVWRMSFQAHKLIGIP